MKNYIDQNAARIEAAKVLAKAMDEARAILEKAGVKNVNDELQEILDADVE